MRENVLNLTVILPDGRIIRTSKRARKSAAGYDLTRLFVGSEGTLGIISEVSLKLYGIPESISSAVCSFNSIEGQQIQLYKQYISIPVARIELLDDVQMDSVNKYSNLNYPVKDTLFMEFHGTENGVKEQSQLVQEIAKDNGGKDFQWTTDLEERNKLWAARHDAAMRVKR